MGMLYSFPCSPTVARTFSEIANAIANAANQDPLFPRHASGCEATVCLLVALAWQGSRFQKWIMRGNRNMGLFQIRIPEGQKVSSSVVMLPVTSAFVAIDRLRESFRKSEGQPLGERLAFFVAESSGEEARPSPRSTHTSRETMILADRLFLRYFPKARMPKPSDLLLPEKT